MATSRVGIERISAYPCTLSLDMVALAEARGADPSHPKEELWVDERSVNPPWEDPVSMACNAALSVLDDETRKDIELLIVGTESSVDFGKPMSTYVQRLAGLGPNVRNFETKHACYGGTSAVMMAAHWVASGVAPGKKALVITSDQSRAHIGKPWEYVLGGTAAAMIISDQPKVVEFELEHNGYWTNEIHDTYRPTAKHEVGHADTSLFGYLEAVEGAYDHFMEKAGQPNYDAYFKKHIYHVPFGGMTYRAHRAVVRRQAKLKRDAMREHFARKSRDSLIYNRRLGGTYTSATFIALMGLIDASEDLETGDRISMFSYGSGSCAEFYSLKLGDHAKQVVAQAELSRGLDERRALTVPEYEAIEELRMSYVSNPDLVTDRESVPGLWESHYAGQGRVFLDKVEGWERYYTVS
jgi:hydroxymethylglutaryl-CoA synthase